MAFNDVDSATEGLIQKTVKTWEAFEHELKILREQAPGQLLFRGQEDSCWQLTTTLERNKQPRMLLHEYYRLMLKVRPQIEAFTGNHWVIPTYPSVLKWTKEYDEFSLRLTSGRLPGYDYMVYLRHHGFPSPLIDWTRSLHVAAYFAFRNAAGDVPTRTRRFTFSGKASSGQVLTKPRLSFGSDHTLGLIADTFCSRANTHSVLGLKIINGVSSRIKRFLTYPAFIKARFGSSIFHQQNG